MIAVQQYNSTVMHSSRAYPARFFGILLASILLTTPATAASAPEQPSEAGTVVATITTLEGQVRMPGVVVELRGATDPLVLGQTTTDAAGQVTFPDVAPGRYMLNATREGFFSRQSLPFDVRSNARSEVLLDIQLTFELPAVEVKAATPPSPTDSVQPVSMSDLLAGSVMELAPIQGDDFQSLLPLLPGVVRGTDGRLRVKGGQPTQGALQISSASLVDPSSGDFDLELPSQSIESVEVLANPFAAEYGRFTTSVTQIRTRRGTNDWEFKPGNLMPRLRKGFEIRGFEPRMSVRGPLMRDRLFLAEDFQFRLVKTPVKSLPDEPEVELTSFDSFTRVDGVLSARHMIGGGFVGFPRIVDHATMNTFRPAEATPRMEQQGASAGVVDRFALASDVVLESTLSTRWFEIEVGNRDGTLPMTYAPETQSGNFFNYQERRVRSVQLVETVSLTRNWWRGQHVLKFGTDLQRSWFEGSSSSRPLEIRRLDGSLAERTEFSGSSLQEVNGLEFSVLCAGPVAPRIACHTRARLPRRPRRHRRTLQLFAPRGHRRRRASRGPRHHSRRIRQLRPAHAPNIEAFESFEPRVVSRFAPSGEALGTPLAIRNVLDLDLHTPEANVANVEWDQRFGRRLLLKAAFLRRVGSHEYIVTPDPAAGRLFASSTGASNYREFETTARYLGGGRRDLTFAYVWAKGTADLNNYDQFYGNFRTPIVRENATGLTPHDVRHRVMVRGTIGSPGKWDLVPVVELRSGFPWSAVNEFQDFVGERNTSGRLPTVRTLDLSISRPWQFKKYRFRAGVKTYNLLGASAERDVQNNLASPFYGNFYNPLDRSIGLLIGASR